MMRRWEIKILAVADIPWISAGDIESAIAVDLFSRGIFHEKIEVKEMSPIEVEKEEG